MIKRRPTHRPQQDCIRGKACLERVPRQRTVTCREARPAHRLLTDLDIVVKDLSDRVQDVERFGRNLRPYAVARQSGKF